MDRLSPKVQKVLESVPLAKRTMTIISIRHDDRCRHWDGGTCNCDPDVSATTHHPPAPASHDRR